jgi:hypothetical protein
MTELLANAPKRFLKHDTIQVRISCVSNSGLVHDIRIGDVVLGIEGTVVSGSKALRDPLPTVARMMHGRPGSVVSLHLLRREVKCANSLSKNSLSMCIVG